MLELSAHGKGEPNLIFFQELEDQLVADPIHAHEVFELVFITKGSAQWQVGATALAVGPGFLGLCPPKSLHRWESTEAVGGRGAVSAIVVRFSPDHLPDSLLKLPELQALRALISAARQPLRFRVVDRDRLRTRLRSIHRASGVLRYARFLVALELIAGFEKTQVAEDKRLAGLASSRSKARFEMVKRFLAQSFREPVTREQAARVAGMEAAAFSRFFRQASGTTFVDYLASLRVRHAASLLGSRRDLTIPEIASASGFHTENAFYRQFRKRLGTTPQAYRKAANIEPQAP